MIIFFDTETTGITNKYWSINDPRQPHIVQLAALQHDEERNVIAQINFIVRPDGYEIPASSAAIHGISHEKAMRYGVPLTVALGSFNNMLKTADLVVAHNWGFDSTVCNIEYGRLDRPNHLKKMEHFCTMLESVDHCKLKHPRNGKLKWPKLQEAYKHFFHREFEGAHNAMHDVNACSEVYYKLKEAV